MAGPLLDVRDLRVTFRTDTHTVTAVDGVSFALGAARCSASSASPGRARA